MKILDVSTHNPLNPGDFGYDLTDAVSVAVQMPKVWKLDDYTWFMGHSISECIGEAVRLEYDLDTNEAYESQPLSTSEMNELKFIRDDGSETTFMSEYKRLIGEGTFCCLFASELI